MLLAWFGFVKFGLDLIGERLLIKPEVKLSWPNSFLYTFSFTTNALSKKALGQNVIPPPPPHTHTHTKNNNNNNHNLEMRIGYDFEY